MTVRIDMDCVRLEGDCHVEDAEALAALLEERPGASVDISACTGLHAAVLQAMLKYRPATIGAPADRFLREWVLPLLHLDPPNDRGAVR